MYVYYSDVYGRCQGGMSPRMHTTAFSDVGIGTRPSCLFFVVYQNVSNFWTVQRNCFMYVLISIAGTMHVYAGCGCVHILEQDS